MPFWKTRKLKIRTLKSRGSLEDVEGIFDEFNVNYEEFETAFNTLTDDQKQEAKDHFNAIHDGFGDECGTDKEAMMLEWADCTPEEKKEIARTIKDEICGGDDE